MIFPILLYFVLLNIKGDPIFCHKAFSSETRITLPRERACLILNFKRTACEC